jgi:hypothetical protein
MGASVNHDPDRKDDLWKTKLLYSPRHRLWGAASGFIQMARRIPIGTFSMVIVNASLAKARFATSSTVQLNA